MKARLFSKHDRASHGRRYGSAGPGPVSAPGHAAALWGSLRSIPKVEQLSRPRSLSFQVTLTVALVILATLLFVGFTAWAMLRIDASAAARERTLISRAIEDRIAAIGREQQVITVWDEAVRFTRAHDQRWMAENVGKWMNSFYGHDQAFVLDDENKPVHAMIEGATLAAPTFEIYSPWISPLVSRVRELMKKGGALGDLVASDVLLIKGRPSIVSVKPIVPGTSRLRLPPGEEYLHVAVKHIDSALLARIGERYLVSNVRFARTGTPLRIQNAVPLAEAKSGHLLGYVVWDHERPGLDLIGKATPGLAASAILTLGVVCWLLVRLRRGAVELGVSEAHARHLASHDTLTGLPNRAVLNEKLEQAIAIAEQGGSKFALHFVDLDLFKNLNDTLGHPTGDELIRRVAARLSETVRESDIVARLGGDEFAIVQSDVRESREAELVAEQILHVIKEPFDFAKGKVFLNASIGIALAPETTGSRYELMRRADIALYEAKSTGKGRHHVFDPALDDVVRQKRAIEEDLRDALDSGTGLRVAFQPLYAIDGSEMIGAEALVRWDHPVHGSISPAVFVPVAEERGLMQRLGNWILREACRTAKQLDLPFIAVNVSAVQFRDPGFVDMVLDLLKEMRLSPDRLQLEITEGLLLDQTDKVATALTKLRFPGVRIALDDFGTGYSSLQYLHRYKVDKIKIDRSFVQRLGASESSNAIVRAMLELARALDLEVTAEGVETREQWQALAALGSPELQGFLFSKPVDPEALRELYLRSLDVDLAGYRKIA